MHALRGAARIAAHLIVLLLAAAWVTGADLSLSSPLFDLARPRVGDVIIAVSGALELSPGGTIVFAHALAGLKLVLGLFLFATVAVAAHDRLRWGGSDDAMLDVGLLLSAVGSGAAALCLMAGGGTLLVGALGELILCALAGALAAFGHGAWWRKADPEPPAAGVCHPA
jgi:hypothetical protein